MSKTLPLLKVFDIDHKLIMFARIFFPSHHLGYSGVYIDEFLNGETHVSQLCVKLGKTSAMQKQPFRGVLRKRCSENMQQIYRRTPMPKCDFNKVEKQLC